jgi:hypothetical protein
MKQQMLQRQLDEIREIVEAHRLCDSTNATVYRVLTTFEKDYALDNTEKSWVVI